jgi:transcriptional regulator with XRE-family HTH domain
LRALREAAGVTQAGWAARLGYGARTIQRWERGDHAPDAAAAEALRHRCADRQLFRANHHGVLAGLTLTADALSALLAEARLGDPGTPAARRALPPGARSRPGAPGRPCRRR